MSPYLTSVYSFYKFFRSTASWRGYFRNRDIP
jgi:hypothetical protein